MPAQIAYLKRTEIDAAKWNACITVAPNGLVYGYTAFLDAMADNWDGLVLDDYRAVMPLPWRAKWGVAYLYQPFLAAQLGVFGREINHEVFAAFLQAVPKKFRLWEFSLNHGNLFSVPDYSLYERVNYVLPLASDYPVLQKGYRENIRRNVKRSVGYGCRVEVGVPVEDVVGLARMHAGKNAEKDLQNFARLFQAMEIEGQAKTYGVLSAKGELLASAAFLFSHGRAYYLLVGNHPNGRTLGASHALIDAFIRDHAGQDLLLDFEGSDLRNLAFFYSSFGAKEERYAAIKLDRLPWWVKVARGLRK